MLAFSRGVGWRRAPEPLVKTTKANSWPKGPTKELFDELGLPLAFGALVHNPSPYLFESLVQIFELTTKTALFASSIIQFGATKLQWADILIMT